MTTFSDNDDRRRDLQDGFERHIYAEMAYVLGGQGIVKVKGTGTEDDEAHMLNPGGMGGNYPKDTNMELYLFSAGSDTSLKMAISDIPRDKKRPWKEGFNGVQKWNDPNVAVQFGKKRTHVIDKNVAIGSKGSVEVTDDGSTVYIRGSRIVFETPPIIGGVPGFQEE